MTAKQAAQGADTAAQDADVWGEPYVRPEPTKLLRWEDTPRSSGDVDAETLVGMDARELATKEVQEMRERVQQEAREAVTDKSGGGVLVWDKFSGTMKMRGKHGAG